MPLEYTPDRQLIPDNPRRKKCENCGGNYFTDELQNCNYQGNYKKVCDECFEIQEEINNKEDEEEHETPIQTLNTIFNAFGELF